MPLRELQPHSGMAFPVILLGALALLTAWYSFMMPTKQTQLVTKYQELARCHTSTQRFPLLLKQDRYISCLLPNNTSTARRLPDAR